MRDATGRTKHADYCMPSKERMLPTAKYAARPPAQLRHEAVIAEEGETLWKARAQERDAQQAGYRPALAVVLQQSKAEASGWLDSAPWRKQLQETREQVDAAASLYGSGVLESDDSFVVEETEGEAPNEEPSSVPPGGDTPEALAVKAVMKGWAASST